MDFWEAIYTAYGSDGLTHLIVTKSGTSLRIWQRDLLNYRVFCFRGLGPSLV